MTTTPIFRCMAAVTKKLKDRELSGAFVRPVATAYMRAIRAQESVEESKVPGEGDLDRAQENLRRALIGFSEQLDDYNFPPNQECSEARYIAAALAEKSVDHTEALHRLLTDYTKLPYAYIVYAIFADFLGDAASGVLALQRWEDWGSGDGQWVDGDGDEAVRIWTGYVARIFQNILIGKIPNDLLKATVQHYDWEARQILWRFRKDFVVALDQEDWSDYCSGASNQELMKIYRLSIQESEDKLAVLLDGNRYGLFSAFANRSIHSLAKVLDGYKRFESCFKKIYSEEAVDYRHAKILEKLGRYKMQYAAYTIRQESALHPDHQPTRLCGEAVKHFESALDLLSGQSIAELRSHTRMDALVKLLLAEGPYNREALRRRLVTRLDIIDANGGCSQW